MDYRDKAIIWSDPWIEDGNYIYFSFYADPLKPGSIYKKIKETLKLEFVDKNFGMGQKYRIP